MMKLLENIKIKFLCVNFLIVCVMLCTINVYAGNGLTKIAGKSTAHMDYPENDAGGYYYAYSIRSNVYNKSSIQVELPELNTNDCTNAYISLGIFGETSGIDFGIAIKNGDNWAPYYFEPSGKGFHIYDGIRYGSKKDSNYQATNDAKYCNIAILFEQSKNRIKFYVQFLNDKKIPTGKVLSKYIYISEDDFITDEWEFYRFVSLIPKTQTSKNSFTNGSYMKNAIISDAKLWKTNGKTVSWKLNGNYINCAFIQSKENCKVTVKSNFEIVNIDHQ